MSFDPRFLWLVVHDLRNPLNVIGLTVRMLQDTLTDADAGVREDLGVLGENVRQLERMLAKLSEFSRLGDTAGPLDVSPFDPRRLVAELVEDHVARASRNGKDEKDDATVAIDVAAGCPPAVELDQNRARLAIQSALANASAAAEGHPVRVVLDGSPGRWITRVVVDGKPRETVRPTPLKPDSFERLLGTPLERVSLELALAARVSELFGGTARLDVDEDRSAVVLDWPTKAGAAGA
jgi:light-regulated signal transduction histidine kinase (bacteriophytochrome)